MIKSGYKCKTQTKTKKYREKRNIEYGDWGRGKKQKRGEKKKRGLLIRGGP